MPIYEFKCEDCRKNFEIICSHSAPAVEVACTKCGSRNTKKTISASSYRLTSAAPAGIGGNSGCGSRSGFS